MSSLLSPIIDFNHTAVRKMKILCTIEVSLKLAVHMKTITMQCQLIFLKNSKPAD
jgi:hypothetical protein